MRTLARFLPVVLLLSQTVATLAERIKNPTAAFSGLDKITGRIIAFDAAIDETVQFGTLQLTPRACYTRSANEAPQTTVFIEVDDMTLSGERKRIFTGWMFAASPGLHAIEHPVYDVWLTDCKGGKSEEPPPAAALPAPAPVQPRRSTLPPPQPLPGPPSDNPFGMPDDSDLPID